MSYKRFIYFLLSFTLLLGCCHNNLVSNTPSPTQLAQQINDTTVAMVDNYGDTNLPYCSGVWVGQNTILTAAHCVVGEMKIERQWLVAQQLIKMGAPSQLAMLLAGGVDELDDNDHSKVADILRQANSMFPVFNPLTFTYYYSVFAEQGDIEHSPTHKNPMNCIALFSDLDLAVLRVVGDVKPHSVVKVSEATPAIGSMVYSVGQTRGNWFSYKQYVVSAYRKSMKIDLEGPFMQVYGQLVGGDSGSGMFDKDGQLVGIVSFTNQESGFGYGISLEHIRGVLIGQHLINANLDDNSDPDLQDATLP